MADIHEQGGATATTESQPSEEEMRAAYEAELNRISSTEMILQTAVSLLNIGGRRLGLAPAAPGAGGQVTAENERDLEQVRDAIDGASALMPILERRMPGELGPLRDAIAQLQVAYAREAQGSAGASSASAASPGATQAPQTEQATPSGQPGEAQSAVKPQQPTEGDSQEGPGPAQASGRLWVPGR
jgi:hypothetical protein